MALNEQLRWGQRWGDNPGGWSGMLVGGAAVSPTEIADDGGEVLTVVGGFGDSVVQVSVGGVLCYSGVSGSGSEAKASSGVVTVIVPAGLAVGAHDVVVTWPGGGTQTLGGAVTVVRRTRRLLAYELARLFPAGAYRARGPVDPVAEAVLD